MKYQVGINTIQEYNDIKNYITIVENKFWLSDPEFTEDSILRMYSTLFVIFDNSVNYVSHTHIDYGYKEYVPYKKYYKKFLRIKKLERICL